MGEPNSRPRLPEQLESLLEKHHSLLHTYVSYRLDPALRRQEGVSDIVQSTLRQILTNRESFTFQGEPAFRAYLWTAVEHKIANKHRHWEAQKRERGLSEPVDDSNGLPDTASPTPSAVAGQREDLRQVLEAVGRLPEVERQVFLMRRLLDMPFKEIVERTGLPESTVRERLGRAAAAVVRHLQD